MAAKKQHAVMVVTRDDETQEEFTLTDEKSQWGIQNNDSVLAVEQGNVTYFYPLTSVVKWTITRQSQPSGHA